MMGPKEHQAREAVAALVDTLLVESDDLTRPATFRAPPASTWLPALDDMEMAIKFGMLRYPFVLAYKDGKETPPHLYTRTRSCAGKDQGGYADHGAVVDLFDDGHSIELGGLHYWNAHVSRACHELSQHLGTVVDAQAFVTPSGRQGLTTHRDRMGVLAVQLHGRKRWRVHAPPEGSWRSGTTSAPGPVVLEETLTAGDVLFFPPGCAHTVVADEGETSVHITFGIKHRTSDEVVNHVVSEFRNLLLQGRESRAGDSDAALSSAEKVLAARATLQADDVARAALDETTSLGDAGRSGSSGRLLPVTDGH